MLFFFSIYFTGAFSSYNCSTPCLLGSFYSFSLPEYHTLLPDTQLPPLALAPPPVSFVGSISSTTFANIEILSGTVPKPLLLSLCTLPTQSIQSQKTIKILCPAPIAPLSFIHIYKGLLDSSSSVSQKHREANVHKTEFMIFLHKT